MKKFVLIHVGFENPTEEVMAEWGKWFESISKFTVQDGNIGFGQAKEVTKDEIKDLEWGLESQTGMSIIEVESMEKAVEIAKSCPSITSIKVYEVRS